jgi:hypothetical protein
MPWHQQVFELSIETSASPWQILSFQCTYHYMNYKLVTANIPQEYDNINLTYLSKSERLILIKSTGVAHFAVEKRLSSASSKLPSPKKSPCRSI